VVEKTETLKRKSSSERRGAWLNVGIDFREGDGKPNVRGGGKGDYAGEG